MYCWISSFVIIRWRNSRSSSSRGRRKVRAPVRKAFFTPRLLKSLGRERLRQYDDRSGGTHVPRGRLNLLSKPRDPPENKKAPEPFGLGASSSALSRSRQGLPEAGITVDTVVERVAQ